MHLPTPTHQYLDGAIKLYLGDSFKLLATMDDWQGEPLVDLVLSDPPYGVHYRGKKSRVTGEYHHKHIANDEKPPVHAVPLMAALMKPDRAMYLCTRDDVAEPWREAMVDAGLKLKTSVVWDKRNWTMTDTFSDYRRQTEMLLIGHTGRALFTPWVDGPGPVTAIDKDSKAVPKTTTTYQGHGLGEGYISGEANRLVKSDTCLWSYPVPRDRLSRRHPSPKPPDLMLRALINHTRPDDLVLDPFMGGGPVGVACALLGRRYIGIELDATYFGYATENIEATLQSLGLPYTPYLEQF